MNTLTLGLMLTCAALIGCVASTVIMPEVRAGSTVSPTAERWEYMCLEGKESPEALALAANVAGAQRWEMVAASLPTPRSGSGVMGSRSNAHWCFKRALSTASRTPAPLPPLPDDA